MTLKVGLTGGIGSGKTTVATIFEHFGVPVFNADKIAKNIITDNESVRRQIIELFGKNSYIGGKYNSSYISGIVFNKSALLLKLNEIVHPAVHEAFNSWYLMNHNYPYVIEEAALLLDNDLKKYFDHMIVVTAPEILRVQRVVQRDSFTEEMVINRINYQMKQEVMIKMADSIIVNDNDNLLLPQVISIHNKLISLHNKK